MRLKRPRACPPKTTPAFFMQITGSCLLLPFLLFGFEQTSWGAKITATQPFQLWRKATKEYENGNCIATMAHLEKVDIPRQLQNSEQISEAFKMLAICHTQLGQVEQAKNALADLLFLDPAYEFNPFDTPTPVLELYKQLKEKIEKKKMELASAKEEIKKSIEPLPPIAFLKNDKLDGKEVKPLSTPWSFSAFLPFGLGHLENGSSKKMVVYFSLQAITLVGNIGSFWWKQSMLTSYGSSQLQNQSSLTTFRIAQGTQYAALAGFLLCYAISVIDGLLQPKP